MSDAQTTPPLPGNAAGQPPSAQAPAGDPPPQYAPPSNAPPSNDPAPQYAPPQPYAPPPQYAAAPVPMSDSDARLWAMFAHLSGIVLAIIGPLIIMLTFGKRNEFVRSQSTEALNFQITVFLATFVSVLLTFVVVGFVLLPIVAIGALVFYIIAGLKAYDGEDYQYPINIRMVK